MRSQFRWTITWLSQVRKTAYSLWMDRFIKCGIRLLWFHPFYFISDWIDNRKIRWEMKLQLSFPACFSNITVYQLLSVFQLVFDQQRRLPCLLCSLRTDINTFWIISMLFLRFLLVSKQHQCILSIIVALLIVSHQHQRILNNSNVNSTLPVSF